LLECNNQRAKSLSSADDLNSASDNDTSTSLENAIMVSSCAIECRLQAKEKWTPMRAKHLHLSKIARISAWKGGMVVQVNLVDLC
jgi:hypothetical protein